MAIGANIYISAVELEALRNAQSHISTLLEAADEVGDLTETNAGLDSISRKARKALQASARQATLKAALAVAQGK